MKKDFREVGIEKIRILIFFCFFSGIYFTLADKMA